MTTISAQVITDSISPDGIRLTTLKLRYPRWIHAEFMTHRVFSRNASSSRAIPVARLIQDVLDDPAVPMFWGANQRGMQAGAEHDAMISIPTVSGGCRDVCRTEAWLFARDRAVEIARALAEAGYHKQLVNRLLEPFSHIEVVVTATEWSNFFALRDHPAAEPHIQLLARRVKEAMAVSTPRPLLPGEWHLPFVTDRILHGDYIQADGSLLKGYTNELGIKLSVARCARTSYLTHEGKTPDVAADLELYDRLVGAVPLHASPCEHQATPDDIISETPDGPTWRFPKLHGNLWGWVQHRKTLPGECQ